MIFDPITRQYKVVETINGTPYRTPSYIDFDTYVKLQAKADETAYFKKRADALTALNKKVVRPPMQVYDKLFDRIFGVSDIIGGAGGQIKQLADQAKQLTLATLQGATELALRSTANLQELRQQVTSKGGTTYAAITTMQAEKMPEAIHQGVDAAYLRAQELGQELA